MVSLDDLPTIAITFVLVAAIFVSGFLVLGGLGDSVDDNNTNNTDAESAVGNVTIGLTNVIEYAPVWGTIIGVAVLLAIVIGGFMFGRQKGMF